MITTWTEVRIKGRPPGNYPPYDFVFKSDLPAWNALDKILEYALNDWEDATVTQRTVRQETTEWTPVSSRKDINE